MRFLEARWQKFFATTIGMIWLTGIMATLDWPDALIWSGVVSTIAFGLATIFSASDTPRNRY